MKPAATRLLEPMEHNREIFFGAFRQRTRNVLLCATLGVMTLGLCPQPAVASSHKKKSHSSSTSSKSAGSKSKHSSSGGHGSSKRSSKHGGRTPKPGESKKHTEPPKPVALRTGDFPAEMASQVASYNSELAEIDALRGKDAKMAQARGEVLKIKKDSFELYRNYISSLQYWHLSIFIDC